MNKKVDKKTKGTKAILLLEILKEFLKIIYIPTIPDDIIEK